MEEHIPGIYNAGTMRHKGIMVSVSIMAGSGAPSVDQLGMGWGNTIVRCLGRERRE